MTIELQIRSNLDSSLLQENVQNPDGVSAVASSKVNAVVSNPSVKRATRKWAAWTREEEETFFTALRQVGKNFEKITQRIQSKNKDQVRHYYYRLVRRMNKLLGPELSLDAKNSKDTNAAMLRWWSLLEKHSCKASKLHLKPRRFKMFVEALEQQLLKDRKKNTRKQSCHSPTAPCSVSNQVFVDSHNLQKIRHGRGSIDPSISVGVNLSNNKEDVTTVKGARQRRKPGVPSSAAYRKWEKAAIAGVSLVADAAAHLERSTNEECVDHGTGQKSMEPVENQMVFLATSPQSPIVESNINLCMKLKLQLFPIDDDTRRTLEMDNHNPHLELTLSNRKKISSVLEHLNRKWGNSTAASGELMLFPYNAQKENLISCQRWTRDSFISTAELHATVGSPSVFRLRYGWFSNSESACVGSQASVEGSYVPVERDMDVQNIEMQGVEHVPSYVPTTTEQSEQHVDPSSILLGPVNQNHSLPHCLTSMATKENHGGSFVSTTDVLWNGKEPCNGTSTIQYETDGTHLSDGSALPAREWADSLTDISVGYLLSEARNDMDTDCFDPLVAQAPQCHPQSSFSCDSFDAAIAAHIMKHQNRVGVPSNLGSHPSSMWDAEETCDAFSFKNNPVPEMPRDAFAFKNNPVPEVPCDASPGDCKESVKEIKGSGSLAEELPDAEQAVDYPTGEDPMDEGLADGHFMDTSAKNSSGLTDLYWPDSLGPLDLDISCLKHQSEDYGLGDSLGGLNRLIASSLDAFQSCSFFGLDKKEQSSVAEPRKGTSFADFKVGSEV